MPPTAPRTALQRSSHLTSGKGRTLDDPRSTSYSSLPLELRQQVLISVVQDAYLASYESIKDEGKLGRAILCATTDSLIIRTLARLRATLRTLATAFSLKELTQGLLELDQEQKRQTERLENEKKHDVKWDNVPLAERRRPVSMAIEDALSGGRRLGDGTESKEVRSLFKEAELSFLYQIREDLERVTKCKVGGTGRRA